jgi:hypothetical protein
LGEVAFSAGGLMPELSFGSHFFQDLVEAEIFYLALFPELDDCFLNRELLNRESNLLAKLLPDDAGYDHVVKVVDFPDDSVLLLADILTQKVLCRREDSLI